MMKSKRFLSILCAVVVMMSASAVFAAGKYNVNFNNVTMKEFVAFVSELTGKNFVYDDKDMTGTVSITSKFKMNADDVLRIFYETMQINDFIAVERDNYIQIIRTKDLKDMDDTFRDEVDSVSGGLVTTIYTMRGYGAIPVAGILNKIRSKFGYVEPIKGLNTLIIRDAQSRIDKMFTIIKNLEENANNHKLTAIEVKNTTAGTVGKQLDKVFAELAKNQIIGETPVIVPDDFSNILIVAATDDELERIKYLTAQIDTASINDTTAPKVFYLNNANAEDVEKVLNKLLSGIPMNPKAQPQGGAAAKVNVSFDKATNAIIALGDQELYTRVEKLIEKLDVPRKQVYVEALILETSLEDGSKFGVEWFGGGADADAGGTIGFINPTGGSLTNYQGSILSGNVPTLPGGFSLGVVGRTVDFNGISFPTLGALLNAVRTDSGINILSNPQILTMDNEEAEVFVGENRPFVTSTKFDTNNNPITTYDYRDVGVRLKITPQISSNDTITMRIEQEVNKISNATFAQDAPVTLTRKTKTKVKLGDSNIMVISGLMKDDVIVSKSGVPYLSRIPLIGWLFKSETVENQKTNMMVFITTKIIRTQEEADALLREKQKASIRFNRGLDKDMEREESDVTLPKALVDQQLEAEKELEKEAKEKEEQEKAQQKDAE